MNCEISIAKCSENTGKDSYISARINDLSAEGIGLYYEKKINASEILDLKFKFKDKPVLKLKGEVKHCTRPAAGRTPAEQFFIGVKFLHSPESLVPVLLKFI